MVVEGSGVIVVLHFRVVGEWLRVRMRVDAFYGILYMVLDGISSKHPGMDADGSCNKLTRIQGMRPLDNTLAKNYA